MNVTEKNLKEFRKCLKERHNDFEGKVGFILSQFVSGINGFGFTLYSQHHVEYQGNKAVFDYVISIKHRICTEWILIELKDYENADMLPNQARKFGENCLLFEQKNQDLKVHRLLIIDEVAEALPHNLTNICQNSNIRLQTYNWLLMLSNQIEGIGPEYALLEYLKNTFNLSVSFEGEEVLTIPAITNSFMNRVNYTFTIPAKKLLPISYVFRATSTADQNLEEAYQRSIDIKRLPKIRKFILSDHIAAMFPTNIVACIPLGSPATIEQIEGGLVNVKLPNQYGSLQIIDGQHRLFSLAKCDDDEWKRIENYPFLVTAYYQIISKDQAKIFFSINDEQTGINPNLICYILSRLLEDKEGYAAYVALQLQDSELFDKEINNGVGKRMGRWLNLKTFVDNLTPSQNSKENLIDFSNDAVRHGWLQKDSKDTKTPLEILTAYFEIIRDTFPTDWKEKQNKGFCQNNAGIAVWLRILLKIAQKNATNANFAENWSRSLFSKYLNKCDFRMLNKKVPQIDADEWRHARNESEYQAIADHLWKKIG